MEFKYQGEIANICKFFYYSAMTLRSNRNFYEYNAFDFHSDSKIF